MIIINHIMLGSLFGWCILPKSAPSCNSSDNDHYQRLLSHWILIFLSYNDYIKKYIFGVSKNKKFYTKKFINQPRTNSKSEILLFNITTGTINYMKRKFMTQIIYRICTLRYTSSKKFKIHSLLNS